MCLKIVQIPGIHLSFSPPFSILLTGLVRTPLQIYEYKAKNCDPNLLEVVEKMGGQEQELMKQGLGLFIQQNRLETLVEAQPQTPENQLSPALQVGCSFPPLPPTSLCFS